MHVGGWLHVYPLLCMTVTLPAVTGCAECLEWSCLCAAVGYCCDVVCCEWTVGGCECVCWSLVAGAPFAVCVAVVVDECFAALSFCPGESGVGWCGCFVVRCLLFSVLGASCVCLDVWASEVCACFECVFWHVSPALVLVSRREAHGLLPSPSRQYV